MMNKSDLRIVFLGTPDFAVESLRRIHTEGFNIVGVVTMPDKPAGRGHHLLQSPVKQYAVACGLPLLQPVSLKDPEFLAQLKALDANLFVVIAFRMLPREVWQMPRLGTFNLHASLLPKYRGAAPINWAVINGDTITGVTTFFLKHEIDTGDIIAQESISISPDENVGSVHDRLMTLGADLTVKTLSSIINGTLTTTSQDALVGDIEPTPAPKIFKDTCHIDWRRPAREIHNLVRGLSPYPAAWTTLSDAADSTKDLTIKILKTAVSVHNSSAAPGTITAERGALRVATADCDIYILELQPQGKRPMDIVAFLNGARISPSHSFINP